VSATAILVFGEALADLIPRDGEGRRYEAALGGSGFNAALALARCGAQTAIAATLSRDTLGRRFREMLAAEGIERAVAAESDLPTPLAMIEPLRPGGEARYRFHLETTALDAAPNLPDGPMAFGHLHFTSFGATVGASGEAALALMRRAKDQGASISYDVNIRPPALPERAVATRLIEQRIGASGIAKASRDDLAWLYPGWPEARVVAHWQGLGAGLVLVTRGADGACCHGRSGMLAGSAPPVAVVDTIGAGDTFMGSFLAVLGARGALGAQLATVARTDLEAALAFACATAADSCTRPGCDPPRRRAAQI
jgi:fructokinase